MIYPHNFETKIGFDEVRAMLLARCLCTLGEKRVGDMAFSADSEEIRRWLDETREMRRIMAESDDFPLSDFFDMREALARLRLEGTYLEEQDLWHLGRSLDTIHRIIIFLSSDAEETAEGDMTYRYPALQLLTDGICIFPNITRRIATMLDKTGQLRDNASGELFRIRQELARAGGSVSRTLNSILNSAKHEGLVERDVTPTLRDGRLVIPVVPAMKRKIRGIVHDESASGRTVFIEPSEVVEANNRIRELEADERREVIRILKDTANTIRPYVNEITASYQLLADIDFIRAKALLAKSMRAVEPEVSDKPLIDWTAARHPLLERSLAAHEGEGKREIVPLDIMLTTEKRMLIVSGPNAGGKSVCLKTAGLLQYMLQCGLSLPVSDRSRCGTFTSLMIDIGDEQSLSDDLSTYSSHLLNMKQMLREADGQTMILIDELGTGTEPTIGGAIAESVLDHLCQHGVWGIVTTHYQNLKEFADTHECVANGAMLYDRHEMRALYQLAIGRPGSSFAIEIARKTGLPESVIQQATDIVGQDYIQSDKYLQDIVRDKRYWEGKRQTIRQRERDMEATILKYKTEVERLETERKEIIARAKAEAQELLAESNRRIEQTIKDIREKQADREATRRIREELRTYTEEVADIDTREKDEAISRKIEQIQQRQKRREERRADKASGRLSEAERKAAAILRSASGKRQEQGPVAVGDTVRIRGTLTVGTLESLQGKVATVVFPSGMRSKLKAERLEHAKLAQPQTVAASAETKAVADQNALRGGLSGIAAALLQGHGTVSRMTRTTIDERQRGFRQELDIRGMRGDEAMNAVQYFIDDAIMAGVAQVRILHGKGNGILRQLIRQYLGTVPNVLRYRDEDIRFGGTGITIAEF